MSAAATPAAVPPSAAATPAAVPPRTAPTPPGPAVVRLGGTAFLVGRRSLLVGACLVLAALLVLVGALTIGKLGVPLSHLGEVLLGGGTKIEHWSVWDNRLPRTLTAFGAGAAFGLSGAIFQSVTRNPLGSPDIIGVSGGAAAGAAIATLLWTAVPVPVGALVGAVVATLLVVGGSGRGLAAPYRMVVLGIGVNAVALAVVQFVLARARENEALTVSAWITGTLSARSFSHVRLIAVALIVLGVGAVLLSRPLAALEMGDEVARGIGIDAGRVRSAAIALGVALAVAAVTVTGPIAFIALVAPQIGRRLTHATGPNLVIAALTGAVLLGVADIVAQHALSSPVPVGIATAAVGGIYLALLLMREWRRGTV